MSRILNITLSLLLFINFYCSAQSIRINEIVSSNSVHYDEDGDTPDWIELYNYGTDPISLLNWGLTDSNDDLHDWQFGNITLKPNEHLVVWASNKNKKEAAHVRTLVDHGDIHKYFIPDSELDSNWQSQDFDDTNWNSGPSGFGKGDDDDATELIITGTSLYTRIKFSIDDLINLTSLIFDVDYDDAFVAYINGVEIARANIEGSRPAYNATSIQGREAKLFNGAGPPDRFIVENVKELLNEGENVLAIQVHNASASSSDMTLIPFLSAITSVESNSGVNPPDILNLSNNTIHTNFKVSSSSEELFLSDENQNIIDQVLVENLKPNTSFGISPLTNKFTYQTNTTPGETNSDISFDGVTIGDIIFSNNGGFLDSSINLSLSGNTGNQVIRYTTDSTEPTETSTLYTSPILISKNTVVRARLFQENYIPSFSESKTYIFDANHEMDVIFLTANNEHLFDEDTGIYSYGNDFDLLLPHFGANFWEDWERPAHFAFYSKESKEIEVEFNAGIKIFGGWSRTNDQRSFGVFARGQYGTSEIEYPFFDALNYDKFQSLVLRNSGNDWLNTSIRDASLTSLMTGSGLDFQAFNPVATYLNDEYWGLYNLREKVNEHFLASKHNVDPATIDLLSSYDVVVHGSNVEYTKLLEYVVSTDLSNDANFEYIKERVDLENLAIYLTAQIYFNNTDWPGNNIKFWKHPEGKWRWILYDTDFGFAPWNDEDYNFNTLSFALEAGNPNDSWPNPDWSTLLFRNLFKNIAFRNQFINRYADELNSRFLPQNVKSHLDNVFAMVEPELDKHFATWASFPSNSLNNLNTMKTFAEKRHNVVKEHIELEFNIPNHHKLIIENNDSSEGLVEINNNLRIQENNWEGDYFETVEISLTAIEKNGFKFSHWSGDKTSNEKTIKLSLTNNTSVTPNFVATTTSEIKNIVINEINYKSGDIVDSGDWIELYNPNSIDIDVSDWILKDDNDSHIYSLPKETKIKANDYLVLVKDEIDFNTAFPNVTNYIGEFDFGFGGNDSVRLYTSDGEIEDEVDYNSEDPWPTCPDGEGPTLELTSSDLDNNLVSNWKCALEFGTPGMINSTILSTDEIKKETHLIYPNPVNRNNPLFINGEKIDKIEIFSVLGNKIIDKNYHSKKLIELNLSDFKAGVYIITINKKIRSKLIIK